MTGAEVVLDTSALVRGLQREAAAAEEVVDGIVSGAIRAHAPDLIGAETTQALLRLVRAGRTELGDATAMLQVVTASAGLVRHPSAPFAEPALRFALDSGLSAYDALYAVLAQLLDLPLLTADRTLAAAVPAVILVT